MNRSLMVMCALLGFTGVAFGAFGAHGLKAALQALPDATQRLGWWETGARYHLVHALAVGLTAVLAVHAPGKLAHGAAWLFLAGTLLFSGSLYVMALTGITGLARLTPLGGICLLVGWTLAGLAAWRLTP